MHGIMIILKLNGHDLFTGISYHKMGTSTNLYNDIAVNEAHLKEQKYHCITELF